ncbi:hypothetical protein TNCV_1039161 [Trichonephila clavipes]|uniref:Uncharacterized protein n=1 Tax=Trichonephila clavipes TaxID=2585209 RepID=A0A8X6VW35_TRICX|nr:hypothetical protein TNCV_1039161 [Trichonephila clavipes]
MKAILRASIDDTQRITDTMVIELRSLPPITIFEAHSHHPIKVTHEKSCACYPIGSCLRFPRPPSPARSKTKSILKQDRGLRD